MKQRIRIDRLEIDLRGIDPALAEAVVELLGPALQQRFMRAGGQVQSAARIDAGRVDGAGNAQALANRLAERIADRTQAHSTQAHSTQAHSTRALDAREE